ncbi:hypothetical protein ACLOJK_039090 [Asimina triloba]
MIKYLRYDVMVLVKKEDTNIRLGFIGHQQLDDELMPNVQVWMIAGSGDYRYEGGYTPVLFGWETSIEPKYLICSGEDVHGKKIKVVEIMVEITGVMQGQKGFDIYCLGHLMRLCLSGGLWVRKKTPILIRTWKRFNRSVVMVDPLLWFRPFASSSYVRKDYQYKICTDMMIHNKKIKVVMDVVVKDDIRRN